MLSYYLLQLCVDFCIKGNSQTRVTAFPVPCDGDVDNTGSRLRDLQVLVLFLGTGGKMRPRSGRQIGRQGL